MGKRSKQPCDVTVKYNHISLFVDFVASMSGVEPFQFEPTYPPGEEPDTDDFEDVEEDENY